jgi:hypothetical protein
MDNTTVTVGLYKNAPWHSGLSVANSTLEFLPTDSQENFRKLCEVPEFLEYFTSQGWMEPGAITYKINSHGFRCDELEPDEDCIVALGCSFTVGIGLPIESTWPALVGKELGLKVYNLAWGGNAADTCFRLAEYWIPKLKPKAVFMLAPPPARFELLRVTTVPWDTSVEVYMPASESHTATEIDTFLKHWFTREENARINQTKNKLAIRYICSELNIPCQIYDAFEHMAWSREDVGYARDRMHAGPKGHERLAKIIINDWRKKHP